ncbi:MAG: cytochrome c biogenesis protein CcsA [Bryobacteraceae bacterium]|nr:cytochrome c biogenesis protein CcsA [Bryobacteraceae bacterium]
MHDMSLFWLRAAVALYAVGLVYAILTVLHKPTRLLPVALGSFTVGVVLHMVSLVELSVVLGHLPLDNFFESMSMCAFLMAVLFLFMYWRYRFTSLAVFLFPLVFIMTLVSATERPVSTWTDDRVRDAWLMIHVLLVLIGYAALLLTAAASIIYLMQEKRLKTKRTGMLDRLPPLGTLDAIITKSMGFAFVFITLSVVAGSTWAFIESGTRWIGDTKVAISLVTWGFYLVMVFLRTSAGWRGRKAAILVLTVVCCSALTWVAHAGLRPMLER